MCHTRGCCLAILDSSIKLNRISFIVSHIRTRSRFSHTSKAHTLTHFHMIYCNKCIPSSGISNFGICEFTHWFGPICHAECEKLMIKSLLKLQIKCVWYMWDPAKSLEILYSIGLDCRKSIDFSIDTKTHRQQIDHN